MNEITCYQMFFMLPYHNYGYQLPIGVMPSFAKFELLTDI